MTPETLTYALFASLALGGGIGLVGASRGSGGAAMSLLVASAGIAGIELLIGATWVAIAQGLFGAAGALALWLSALALAGPDAERRARPRRSRKVVAAAALATGGMLAGLLFGVVPTDPGLAPRSPLAEAPEVFAALSSLCATLFGRYALATSLCGLLLLAVGVATLALSQRGDPS